MSELVWRYCCSPRFCIALSPEAPPEVAYRIYLKCRKRQAKPKRLPKNPPYDLYRMFGLPDTDIYFKIVDSPKGDWLQETFKATFLFYSAVLGASSSSPPQKLALALAMTATTLDKFKLYKKGLEKVLPWRLEKYKPGESWVSDFKKLLEMAEEKVWLRRQRL